MPVCRHPDIQKFDGFRCCLSCGEAVFEDATEQNSDTTPSTDYRYKRLNYELGQEIRLVILYPGIEQEDLTCDIVHVNLLDKPAYEAVSYTWATADGDVSLSGHITCRGKKIAITMNCESVLRSLRHTGQNRKIWVDAICIDQKNTPERNHQVKMMATIYTNASQVLAYLTTATSGSLNRVISHLDEDSGQLSSRIITPSRQDVEKFLRMPYFDRVWILQEIALANIVTLVVGKRTLRWTANTVSTLLGLCMTFHLQAPSVLRWLPASQPEAGDLLDVLHRSRNCSATDKRDKVYALLGLVNAGDAGAVPVDYSKTPNEIFTEIAIHLLQERGRVDVVLHALCGQNDTLFVPSWVPQWDIKSGSEPLPPQFTSTQLEALASSWYFEASTGWPPNIAEPWRVGQHATDYDTNFRFKILDRTRPPLGSSHNDLPHESDTTNNPQRAPESVHENSEPSVRSPPCLRVRAQFLDTIKSFLRIVAKDSEFILPRETPEAFCNRDACSGCLLRAFGTTDAQLVYQELGNTIYNSRAEPKHVERQQRESFKRTMKRLGHGKTPFETQSSIGFAQEWRSGESIRSGDTVWALAGLAVPVILRREGDHYILVGECYLFRAALPFLCAYCGAEARPWPMTTEVIDIW